MIYFASGFKKLGFTVLEGKWHTLKYRKEVFTLIMLDI